MLHNIAAGAGSLYQYKSHFKWVTVTSDRSVLEKKDRKWWYGEGNSFEEMGVELERNKC